MENVERHQTILSILKNLQRTKVKGLEELFWTELNYARENKSFSRRQWPDRARRTLAEDPLLFASGGEDGSFHVIYCRLAEGGTCRGFEAPVLNQLLRDHPFALFVFSNRSQSAFHFMNVKYDASVAKRHSARIISTTFGVDLQAVAEHMALLDLATIGGTAPTPYGPGGTGPSTVAPLLIQQHHDSAFADAGPTGYVFQTIATRSARIPRETGKTCDEPSAPSQQANRATTTATPSARKREQGALKVWRIPPKESGRVEDRVIYVDGKCFLLPQEMRGWRGPMTMEQFKLAAKDMKLHVLITGETGTGKESLALHLRDLAEIPAGKWGSVNCASLPPNLADSELFGHVVGAFTGANKERAGILKANEGGAVFLDEIGRLPEATQGKLLRFLDCYELRPVGADSVKKVITRIVAATNADINKALVHDLPPRFDFKVELPPLRDRLGDIPWLLNHDNFLGNGGTLTGITWRTLCALLVHEYPKNMRDLRNLCLHLKHQCPTDVFVLDAVSIMGDEAGLWARFAGFALAAIESHGAGPGLEDMKREGVLELCTLLLGIMGDDGGDGGTPAIRIADLPTLTGDRGRIFCVHMLNDALAKECEEFDWRGHPDFSDHCPLTLFTIGEAFGWMKNWMETYKSLDETRLSELAAHRDMLSLRQQPKEHGSAFLDNLRRLIRETWRWDVPRPREVSELELVLNEKGIEGELRRACLYCAAGLSNPEIAARPDIMKSLSWVQENLQRLRSDEHLARLLPIADAGRKKSG